MKRLAINSSSVASVGYDAAAMTLEVEFTNGIVYQYFDVPKAVYQQMISAPSPGQFLNGIIKGTYRYTRL